MHCAWGQAVATATTSVAAVQTTTDTAPLAATQAVGANVSKSWHVTLPTGGKFPIQGMMDYGKVGASGGTVLYPGGHPAVFLGALLVHGILNSAAQSERESAEQSKANEVLQPYSKAIAGAKLESMFEQALKTEGLKAKLVLDTEKQGKGLRVLSSPEFFLHPDIRGLVLAHRIELYQDASDKPIATTVIRLSTHFPRSSVIAQQWRDDEGAGLLNASQDLLQRSLRILDRTLLTDVTLQTAEEATVKHNHLGERKIERAQVLLTQCDRALLKNLRGELMGVQLWTGGLEASESPAVQDTKAACTAWF